MPPPSWRVPFRRGAAGAQATVGDLLAWRRAPHAIPLAGTVAVTALVTFTVIYSAFSGSDQIPVDDSRPPLDDVAKPNFPVFLPPSPTSPTPSSPSSASPTAPSSPSPRPTTPKPSASEPPASKPAKEPPASKPEEPPSARTWALRSVNYPDRYVRVRHDGSVWLDRPSGGGVTFTMKPGLADRRCYSFAARNGAYLRHSNFRLRLAAPDGSKLFKEDATFCKRPGAVRGSVAWESYNYPGRFLRHRDFRLRLDRYERSRLFGLDTSFRLTSPP